MTIPDEDKHPEAAAVWRLRLQMLTTAKEQALFAVEQGMPPWMKFAGEPALPYNEDPSRRRYMLSDAAYHGVLRPGYPWRTKVDTDFGRFVEHVRR